jgi:hypothetical protein
MKVENALSQGIAVDSENFSTAENEYDDEHRSERGSFRNTMDNIKFKKGSQSGNLEVNGNDVNLERMSAGLPYSHVAVQIEDKNQSCLKKSLVPRKKKVTFKTGHSAEARRVKHGYDTEGVPMNWPTVHPIIKKFGRELELKLERIHLPMKGKCHRATSVVAKVSNKDVQEHRTMKTKSVLDSGDVMPQKRRKTVDLISKKNVITEDRCVMKRNGCSNSKWSKSAPAIKRNKQFGLVYDCEVKLERLSPEFLRRTISKQKKQQSVETRSVAQVRQSCKTDNSFYFQKSSDTNYGTKERTNGNLVLKEEGGSFGMQIFDGTWGSDRIDAWGNVRYLLKGESNLSESEEDWYGWWVRVDSLRNLYNAHLYSISDGVTESRIMVWDNPSEAKATLQNNTIQVFEQTEYAPEESQHSEEEWAGWKVLYIEKNIGDASSIGFSDEEADEFHGW